jgi:hypothetical protein
MCLPNALAPSHPVFYDIRYAKLLSDGGNAALTAIRFCNTIVLWEFQRKGENKKNYYFRDLIQFYLDCFENRKEAIRLRLEHNELLADLGLRGWDFEDLRDCTAFFRYRLIPPPYLSGRPDWWSLTKNPNLMANIDLKPWAAIGLLGTCGTTTSSINHPSV